jgi:hypothetical protein
MRPSDNKPDDEDNNGNPDGKNADNLRPLPPWMFACHGFALRNDVFCPPFHPSYIPVAADISAAHVSGVTGT